MAMHTSILAWRVPWTEEPGGLQSMGSQRVGYDWSDLVCMHHSLLHNSTGVQGNTLDVGDSNQHRFQFSISSVELSSVTQSCPTLCDPMNRSTPGLPVHHQLPEFTQTHVHRVGDAIQPSHPLSSSSPPAPNPPLCVLKKNLHKILLSLLS